MKKEIALTVNGMDIETTVDEQMFLLEFLRDSLGLTGTKEGCGEGECGACTVIVNGQAVNSCLYPVLEAAGKDVVTIEGLPDQGQLSHIQQSFVDYGAIQCGYCTPGMIMSTKALLDCAPNPSEDEIRTALLGNLCRCTGYTQIIEAVRKAAQKLEEKP